MNVLRSLHNTVKFVTIYSSPNDVKEYNSSSAKMKLSVPFPLVNRLILSSSVSAHQHPGAAISNTCNPQFIWAQPSDLGDPTTRHLKKLHGTVISSTLNVDSVPCSRKLPRLPCTWANVTLLGEK